jgi:uncharacterized membrane protein YccC
MADLKRLEELGEEFDQVVAELDDIRKAYPLTDEKLAARLTSLEQRLREIRQQWFEALGKTNRGIV